jgi:phage terminase small subunit
MLPEKNITQKEADALLGTTPTAPDINQPQQFSAEVQAALAKLNPRKAQFVLNVISGLNQTEALIQAGWKCSRKVANSTASHLLREDEDVRAAMDILRLDMVKRAEYSFDKFMNELNDSIAFARATKNATALVRAVELKGKASGHIVDRVDTRNLNAGFSINIRGVDDEKPAVTK